MNQKQLAEIIAIIRKMEIDNRVDLSDMEKELLRIIIILSEPNVNKSS